MAILEIIQNPGVISYTKSPVSNKYNYDEIINNKYAVNYDLVTYSIRAYVTGRVFHWGLDPEIRIEGVEPIVTPEDFSLERKTAKHVGFTANSEYIIQVGKFYYKLVRTYWDKENSPKKYAVGTLRTSRLTSFKHGTLICRCRDCHRVFSVEPDELLSAEFVENRDESIKYCDKHRRLRILKKKSAV